MVSTTRVALVTGAARGIGRATALRLAEDGFDVAVNDLPNTPELNDVLEGIQSKGRRSLAVPADVSLESEVVRMVQDIVSKLGSLDVMVANAGIILYRPLLDTTVEEFDRLMAVNVRSVMLCYKYAAKQMIAQGHGGRIIGACSAAGKQGASVVAGYSASKFAIRGLTQAAAQEFGKHGITVNAYAPGLIDTRMIDELGAITGSRSGANPEGKGDVPDLSTPIPRIGTPEEVAALVSYLASEGVGFVTGQSININGGMFLE